MSTWWIGLSSTPNSNQLLRELSLSLASKCSMFTSLSAVWCWKSRVQWVYLSFFIVNSWLLWPKTRFMRELRMNQNSEVVGWKTKTIKDSSSLWRTFSTLHIIYCYYENIDYRCFKISLLLCVHVNFRESHRSWKALSDMPPFGFYQIEEIKGWEGWDHTSVFWTQSIFKF